MLIIEDSTVSAKCKTAIKVLLFYFSLCLKHIIGVSHVHLHILHFLLSCYDCSVMSIFLILLSTSTYHVDAHSN
jgi:hypothetical protein